uniref:Paired domain-containing protein n=1 Tax=Ditylenchus dipsaci TaxID=166011 RepID=A0A915ER93_9BILA
MPKRLSEDIQKAIVAAVEAGIKRYDIQNTFNVSVKAISEILKRKRERGSLKTARITGRPRKTSEKTDRWIVRQVKIDPKQASTSINRDLEKTKFFFALGRSISAIAFRNLR